MKDKYKENMDAECESYYKDGGTKACGKDREPEEYPTCVEVPEALDVRFFRCEVCGQVVAVLGTKGNPLTCCMREMQLLEPGTVEATAEKHIPVFEKMGHKVTVKVGEILHPMTKEHHIEWVCLVTNEGVQWKNVKDCAEPIATFRLRTGEHVAAIYAYCNLHKLWKCC